jgi:shikimate dehydrogenase
MHRKALTASGLLGTYEAVQCDSAEFLALVAELRGGKWDGFNVTMPHKISAFDNCDRTTDAAARSGSVNTLKMVGDGLVGHSSDVVAFEELFAAPGFAGLPIHVLGAGGSAAAAVAAADREVYLSARNSVSVARLRGKFGAATVTEVPVRTPIAGALVVNATPVGMEGELLGDGLVECAGGLIDLPYGGVETPAVLIARTRSIPFCDGYRFLALQAAESFLWWTGHRADADVIEAAARNG